MLLVLYFFTEIKLHLAQNMLQEIQFYSELFWGLVPLFILLVLLFLFLKIIKMQRAFFFTYQKSGLAHEKSPLLSDLMLPERVKEKDQKLRCLQTIHKSTTFNVTQSLPEGEILRRLQM